MGLIFFHTDIQLSGKTLYLSVCLSIYLKSIYPHFLEMPPHHVLNLCEVWSVSGFTVQFCGALSVCWQVTLFHLLGLTTSLTYAGIASPHYCWARLILQMNFMINLSPSRDVIYICNQFNWFRNGIFIYKLGTLIFWISYSVLGMSFHSLRSTFVTFTSILSFPHANLEPFLFSLCLGRSF
jgi:hypothetical protein